MKNGKCYGYSNVLGDCEYIGDCELCFDVTRLDDFECKYRPYIGKESFLCKRDCADWKYRKKDMIEVYQKLNKTANPMPIHELFEYIELIRESGLLIEE